MIESNRIVKIGLVVRNLEDVAKRYGELFHVQPPQVRIPDPDKPRPEGVYQRYMGKDNRIMLKSACVELDPVYLELIEPFDNTPSPWLDHLEKHGSGVCFISFYIGGFEQHIDMMGRQGYPLLFQEEKGFERYAYFETIEKLGVMMELKERDPQ